MSGKQIFVFGLLLIPIGFVMFMCGRQEARQASQLDAAPEAISLQQLIAGEYSNKHLFELSQFRPGKCFHTEVSKSYSIPSYTRVPLYVAGQGDDDGERIRVIARVPDVADSRQLRVMLQEPVVVQKWNFVPSSEIAYLLADYPQLDTRNIIEIFVGDELPSRRAGYGYFAWSALWFTLGAGCLFYTFFVHLDVLGRRKTSAMVAYGMQQVDRKSWKTSDVELLDAAASRFDAWGFQPVGYVQEKRNSATNRRALHLSPDQKCLLAISVNRKQTLSTLMGVASNGQYLSLGKGADDLTIDGRSNGVPLLIRTIPLLTPDELLCGFESLVGLLPAGTELAVIEPTQAASLVHYRALLLQWWTLLNSHSHEVPDELPHANEIIQIRNGVPTFCWGDLPSDAESLATCEVG